MPNLKLTIEYDGTDYAGWQTQHKKHKTIQQVIEDTLRVILQQDIKLIGSGRTDAGVHALGQVANFKTGSSIPPERLKKALNALLPKDIVICSVEEAEPLFHSRFAAKTKAYRYAILNRDYPSAILRARVHYCPHPLDIARMQKEAACLLGRHDFKAFQASSKKEKNPVKIIKKLAIRREGDIIYFDIEADGFLYNMVRNIVGTLIEIGRGRLKKGYLKRLLLSKDRRLAGPTAPAKGLCLMKVGYMHD
jgi:tRNA pseudouridine38-40 synthase